MFRPPTRPATSATRRTRSHCSERLRLQRPHRLDDRRARRLTLRPGHAQVEGDRVLLSEGDSFHVALEHTFVIPAGPHRSRSVANLAFDTITRHDQGRLRGHRCLMLRPFPGAHHRRGPRRLLQHHRGPPPRGSGELSGPTVTLDLSGVFAGTTATLVIRLVNNDRTTGPRWRSRASSALPVGHRDTICVLDAPVSAGCQRNGRFLRPDTRLGRVGWIGAASSPAITPATQRPQRTYPSRPQPNRSYRRLRRPAHELRGQPGPDRSFRQFPVARERLHAVPDRERGGAQLV